MVHKILFEKVVIVMLVSVCRNIGLRLLIRIVTLLTCRGVIHRGIIHVSIRVPSIRLLLIHIGILHCGIFVAFERSDYKVRFDIIDFKKLSINSKLVGSIN